MDNKKILEQMTLEEKASLCSGADFWNLKSIERLGLNTIMMTDGPHGLRKQAGSGDHLGINDSIKATCFPTESASANSFDCELIYQMGEAIGEECLQEDVAVVLGPGANIKRSPLCGRNFEYISEDPYVTGELATAFIQGIQTKGIGTSLKHFALNNQEHLRMVSDSQVDERAMREIYLAGFETAVTKAQPFTVMSSYNRLNGIYASENKYLLTDILRNEWGFEGLVVTDWGATNDRVKGVQAGLDLEMPATDGYNTELIITAVKEGQLKEEDLDKAVLRVIELITKTQDKKGTGFKYNQEAHHQLAKRVAAESAVLLKNKDAILPIDKKTKVAVIGQFAKTPRYQGTGSSKINPYKTDNVLEELGKLVTDVTYSEGYSLKVGAQPDERLIKEACDNARSADVAIVLAGLPDEYESEGFDRTTLDMPKAHNRLIEAVAASNPNTVVVLQIGAPVIMPWREDVKAILLGYLGGEAGGSALAAIICGMVNPSGKLAESFPLKGTDIPCYNYFASDRTSEEYRESIYVGYRYYDKVEKEVAYPFGYGLSYTKFKYSNISLSSENFHKGEVLTVKVTIENIGTCAGAEVVQLYIGKEQDKIFRAPKELKGFSKVYLEAGKQREVEFELAARSFAYYNVKTQDWAIEGGEYNILIGTSSQDIIFKKPVQVKGDGDEELLVELRDKAPTYYQLPAGTLEVPKEEFVNLYGRELPQAPSRNKPFNVNNTLSDIQSTFLGRQLYKIIFKKATAMFTGPESVKEKTELIVGKMLEGMPLRLLVMMTRGAFDMKKIKGLLKILNGFRK